jgi:EAL domain-containing protein (putative c-di-GMP-specific phosphodiesterase class I)
MPACRPLKMAVNLSARQLKHPELVARHARGAWKKPACAPILLEVEITERHPDGQYRRRDPPGRKR